MDAPASSPVAVATTPWARSAAARTHGASSVADCSSSSLARASGALHGLRGRSGLDGVGKHGDGAGMAVAETAGALDAGLEMASGAPRLAAGEGEHDRRHDRPSGVVAARRVRCPMSATPRRRAPRAPCSRDGRWPDRRDSAPTRPPTSSPHRAPTRGRRRRARRRAPRCLPRSRPWPDRTCGTAVGTRCPSGRSSRTAPRRAAGPWPARRSTGIAGRVRRQASGRAAGPVARAGLLAPAGPAAAVRRAAPPSTTSPS